MWRFSGCLKNINYISRTLGNLPTTKNGLLPLDWHSIARRLRTHCCARLAMTERIFRLPENT
ncbi:MAG: hypothetical protein IJV56_07800 [Neisseriaceae bacterium]|nr:hypothetical protein [Neisseriaceae bacterium]MBQ9725223.1 hypothetical protein [Neisseriaceae bacterium]